MDISMSKNRCSSVYLKIIFYFSSLFVLTCNPVELSSAPNYYYSAINYSEYQTLGELEQNDQTEKIEIYLQRFVPGLSVTYSEVIDTMIAEGHHVYLRGGIIRDLLSITTSEPNDVDLDYTGKVEELIAICEKNHWRYTHFPKRQIVIIGDYRYGSIDAMPVRSDEESAGDAALEFTINNIFYHCNTRSFLRGSEIGLQDISFDRLNIIANDWNAWLYQPSSHPYYKIFRFWKMVGKGYVYSTELQKFFYQETSKIIKKDEDGFKRDISHYLSGHLYSFDDVYHGAIAIMGYHWAQENVFKVKGEVTEQQALIYSERDQHTFYP